MNSEALDHLCAWQYGHLPCKIMETSLPICAFFVCGKVLNMVFEGLTPEFMPPAAYHDTERSH
jgi:hypothetical protein